MEDIRDIKPLLTLEFNWQPAALAALGLLLILLGTYLWWRLRKRKPALPEAVPPPFSAFQMALRLLQALADERLIEQGLIAEFYLRLSRIMREFFEAVFGFPATGFTSRELLRALAERRVGAQLVQMVEQFYQQCDFVKFTTNLASAQEMQEALAMARRLVQETERQVGNQRTGSVTGEQERQHVAAR